VRLFSIKHSLENCQTDRLKDSGSERYYHPFCGISMTAVPSSFLSIRKQGKAILLRKGATIRDILLRGPAHGIFNSLVQKSSIFARFVIEQCGNNSI